MTHVIAFLAGFFAGIALMAFSVTYQAFRSATVAWRDSEEVGFV